MKRFLFILISILSVPCIAQKEVVPFLSGVNEGITYCLPDTRIEITVETACITRTPGEFSRYAERFLRISNAISKQESYWVMGDINIALSGKPNPDKRYTIKLSTTGTAANVSMDENGIISGINIQAPQETVIEENPGNTTNEKNDASKYMTEEMLQATSTAKLAELTAKEIYTIRESKLAITRGLSENMPKDGLSMQLVLDELDKQEKALTEMFIGHTDTTYQKFSYTLEPAAEFNIDKAILFRFSRKLGILDKEDLAGSPVYYNLKDLESIKFPTPEELANKKTVKKDGVCYNIPGKAEFEIYTAGRTLFKKEIPLAQLGTTEVLAKTLFSKNTSTKVRFDTATGGIISIEK
jgi:hypothetical protein